MRTRNILSGALAASLLAVGTVVAVPNTAQAANNHDGKSPETAAASCWEIKRTTPWAPSGSYWLQTPAMDEPQQFFCEQGMDGGGWVLVGRGRDGWENYGRGQGDPAALAQRPRTRDHLNTVQHSEATINALLNHQAVSSLRDGIRVLRVSNANGTAWQRADFRPAKMEGWQWPFGSHHTGTYRFDNGFWYNGATALTSFGTDTRYRTMDMSVKSNSSYKLGFGYGKNVWNLGDANPRSFVWRDKGSAPLPYSEVYVRPTLSSTDGFNRIPDDGLAGKVKATPVSDLSTPGTWGVVGNLNGKTTEGNSPAQAFAQIGDTVFVGGNFTGVQSSRHGQHHARTAVAAFNATTGRFIPSFNVNLNNQVKALLALPNGKLLIGGDFTIANGERHVGTVVVDPITGETDSTWDLQIENRIRSAAGRVSVRSLELDGNYIYAGGFFTHLNGKGVRGSYGRNAARLLVDGRPDRSWNPELNGTVADLDVNGQTGRVYAAGYFTRTKNRYALKTAVLSTQPGADMAVTWNFQPSMPDNATYQQAVKDTGNLVFVGGAQHSVQAFTPHNMGRVAGSILTENGGDIQAMASDGNILYASCHCFDRAYENAYTYPQIGTSWTRADRVQALAGWDARTGKQTGWTPYLLRSKNAGAWGLFIANDGALWVGGDFTASMATDGRNYWNGGFARYPAQSTQIPATPAHGYVQDMGNGTVTATWQATPDAAKYHVLRDDRVIATTTDTSINLPNTWNSRYFIRAVDAYGNLSATTAAIRPSAAPQPPIVEEPEQPAPADTPADAPAEDNATPAEPTTLVGADTQWSYYYDTAAPSANWNQPVFNTGGWNTGQAPLGYGYSKLVTSITPPAPPQRPITAYFRTEFDLADTQAALTMNFVADDGAIVYVNGREVTRVRMPEGSVGHMTRSHSAISANAAYADRTSVEIPAEYLVAGKNVIAVETHANYRSTSSLTFDATVTSQVGAR